jgi:hypothetical protein
MESLNATIEEFAAAGYTHVECYCPRCRNDEVEAISPGFADYEIISLGVGALLCFRLVSWAAAAQGQLTFQTLDGDTQLVNPEEIWRTRATSTIDEPSGAVAIDYGFERVYVKTVSTAW